jgi:hypothetical protein
MEQHRPRKLLDQVRGTCTGGLISWFMMSSDKYILTASAAIPTRVILGDIHRGTDHDVPDPFRVKALPQLDDFRDIHVKPVYAGGWIKAEHSRIEAAAECRTIASG